MPERIRLRRTSGWRMPPNTVKVDRSTHFGNPFRVGDEGVPDVATSVRLFEQLWAEPRSAADYERYPIDRDALRVQLRGRNLACWCSLEGPCHADVLLRLVNE